METFSAWSPIVPISPSVDIAAPSDVELLRHEIRQFGPHSWSWYDDVSAGTRYKRYQISRPRKGGNLGSSLRTLSLGWDKLDDRERQRVNRYMFDRGEQMFQNTALAVYFLTPLLGDAIPSYLLDGGKG